MTLPSGMVNAVYRETGVPSYQGNPLIEALPPILERKQLKAALGGSIKLRPADIYLDGETRIHIISQLLDGFFQPLARHIQLESKKSGHWRPHGAYTERLRAHHAWRPVSFSV